MEHINTQLVQSQSRKPAQVRLEYMSEETKNLIDKKQVAKLNENLDGVEILEREIKDQLTRDKIQWMNDLVNELLTRKDNWQGVKLIRSKYKPRRYAKRNKNGQIVDLDQRAEATKNYLEMEHWGKRRRTEDEVEATERLSLEADFISLLEEKRIKFRNAISDTSPITLEGHKEMTTELLQGKAPGPDNITFD